MSGLVKPIRLPSETFFNFSRRFCIRLITIETSESPMMISGKVNTIIFGCSGVMSPNPENLRKTTSFYYYVKIESLKDKTRIDLKISKKLKISSLLQIKLAKILTYGAKRNREKVEGVEIGPFRLPDKEYLCTGEDPTKQKENSYWNWQTNWQTVLCSVTVSFV